MDEKKHLVINDKVVCFNSHLECFNYLRYVVELSQITSEMIATNLFETKKKG